jgi:transposase
MKALSSSIISSITNYFDNGYSYREIASIMGVSIGTITNIIKKYRPDSPKSVGGCKKKLSATSVRHATRLITSGKVDTAVQVHKVLQNKTNNSISVQTVRRALKEAGMKPAIKKKRPILSKKHQRERMDFGLAHLDWTVEDWKRVIWSDETKINRFGSDGRAWVWKKQGESLSARLVNGTLKFGGGSLMMWGCFCWQGVGYACKIDGKMDCELYCQILEEDLQKSIEFYGIDRDKVIFQQDNDPKHTSRLAKQWFQDNGIEVMVWPPQSPDLNPIEHLWRMLKMKLAAYEEAPEGILELWERVQNEWEKIDTSICQKLIESLPSRMEAVVKAKGGYTKY